MLSATELNITEAEHAALQAVAAGLAAGLYVHHITYEEPKKTAKYFTMNNGMVEHDCGTIGCIGGYVALEIGKSKSQARIYVWMQDSRDVLYPLYFPQNVYNWNRITPAIASKAIYQFLDGKPVDYSALLDAA